MVQALSEKIVTYAIHNNYIKQEQYEEYMYALNMVLNILCTDITMFVIGFVMRMVWECIVFWIVYKVLRKYCGGFHFSTSLKCYLSSCVMCPLVLLLIRYIPYNFFVWGIAAAVAAAVLFVLSPVPAVNKPLDDEEAVVFGKIARLLTLLMIITYIIVTALNLYMLSKIISLSAISVMIFVVAGKIQRLYLQKNI